MHDIICRVTEDYVELNMKGCFQKNVRDRSALVFEPKDLVDKVLHYTDDDGRFQI